MGIPIRNLHTENAATGLPAMPEELFVGTMEGVSTCTPDERVHDIWPKFMVMVLLQGRQHFVIDNTAFTIDAGRGEAAAPVVFMLNVARYAKLRFINDSDTPLRKIMISAPLPWVSRLLKSQNRGVPALRTFLDRHLAAFRFHPGQHAVTLAEQLMRPPPLLQGEIGTLFRNSRALELMMTGCTALLEESGEMRERPILASKRQAERVRDHVMAGLRTELTIMSIARDVGASVSVVQRNFKSEFGMTVFEFIRLKRLEQARNALEQDGIGIAQAAFEAGYANATAFTAAYKKTFGVAPRHHRR